MKRERLINTLLDFYVATMTEAFKNLRVLAASMDNLQLDEHSRLLKRVHYLELYLCEHPHDGPYVDEISTLLGRLQSDSLKALLSQVDGTSASVSLFQNIERLYGAAKKIRKQEREQQEQAYRSVWTPYQFIINWEGDVPHDEYNDAVDVTLIRPDGHKYWANFVTRTFLNNQFEENKRTGECAGGTYFRMPNMIPVDRITEETVRRTIDDFINGHEIEECFTPREEDQ